MGLCNGEHVSDRPDLYAGDCSALVPFCTGIDQSDSDQVVVERILSMRLAFAEKLNRSAKVRLRHADDPIVQDRFDRAEAKERVEIQKEVAAVLERWWPGFKRMGRWH
jgi:hypothetical protein